MEELYKMETEGSVATNCRNEWLNIYSICLFSFLGNFAFYCSDKFVSAVLKRITLKSDKHLMANGQWPSHNTGSRPIAEVKQHWTWLVLTREWSDPTCRNLPRFFFFTARVHTTKSTIKILAANTH
jgi:hypothetical protein